MRPWKVQLPASSDLAKLISITPKGVFANPNGDPVKESIFLLGHDDDWISLSWDYADIEFKFEMYFVALNQKDGHLPQDLIPIYGTAAPSSMQFLLRTEWVRPARAGEVPANFEQVVEESGTAASVPSSATAIGTCLYGVVFNDAGSRPLFAVTVDDTERYSLRVVSGRESICELIGAWDCCTYSQLLSWEPPRSLTR